jgi:hypothetical protein
MKKENVPEEERKKKMAGPPKQEPEDVIRSPLPQKDSFEK